MLFKYLFFCIKNVVYNYTGTVDNAYKNHFCTSKREKERKKERKREREKERKKERGFFLSLFCEPTDMRKRTKLYSRQRL